MSTSSSTPEQHQSHLGNPDLGSSDAEIAAHTTKGRANLELVFIGLAALAASMSQTLLIPVLGTLPEALDVDATDGRVQWLLTSTLLVAGVSVPLFGRLGDMFGKRLMLLVAVSLMLVGSVVTALTSNIDVMIVGRAIQGISMSAIPLGISLASTLLPREKVGTAIAIISAMMGVGGAIAMPLGGIIGEYADFHWIFWISAMITLVALVGIFVMVPEAPNRTRGRVDVLGAVLLAAALVSLLYGLSESNKWGWGSGRLWLLLAAALVLFLLFGLWQNRSKEPLVDLSALRRTPIILTNIAAVFTGFAMFAMMIGTANYVQVPAELGGYGFGSSIVVAGLCMLPGGLMMFLISPVAARLIHRFGAPRMLAAGGIVIALGWVLRIVMHAHLWEVIVGTTVASAGVAIAFAAMPTLINTHTPVNELAAANGLNSLARSIGASVSSAIGGAILTSMTLAGTGVPTLDAYRVLFAICAGSALVAALVAVFVPRHPSADALPEA